MSILSIILYITNKTNRQTNSALYVSVAMLLTIFDGTSALVNSLTSPRNVTNRVDLRVVVAEYPVALYVERDPVNNSLVNLEGISYEMLKWLSEFDKFSFSFPPIPNAAPLPIENTTDEIVGSIFHVHTDAVDLILGSIVMTPYRFEYLDFPHPWMTEDIVLVIPVPDSSNNIGSIWQPLQWPVWLLVVVSLPLVTLVLYVLHSARIDNSFDDRLDKNCKPTNRANKLWLYVFGLLLSQGGRLKSNRPHVRLVAGCWCLVTFVLVQAYSSTLISFMTTPTLTPLVKSPEDLASQTQINAVVRKYLGTEVVLLTSQVPLMKKLGDKLRSYPKSRCLQIEDCLELVALGNHVLLHGYGALLDALKTDYKATGKCRFSLAKNILFSRSYALGLAKKSRMTELFNRGILRMKENGFIIKWNNRFQPKPNRCMNILERPLVNQNRRTSLTLKNLTGAFVVLMLGYFFSVITFTFEKGNGNRERLQYKTEQLDIYGRLITIVNATEDGKNFKLKPNHLSL